MQVQLDDIASGKPLLWQGGKEEFIDHTRTRDSNGALLLACWMGGYDHAAEHVIGSDRNLWAVVEAAFCLAFWTLLDLIRREMQTGRDARMIEQVIVFATGHKCEACHI